MKLRELEQLLQGVEGFGAPKVEYEQYITRPHIAARIIHTIGTAFEDLEDTVVVDLGCGTGVLSMGCALLGCPYVVGVDIDSEALHIAHHNIHSLDPDLPIELVCADVEMMTQGALGLECDVVVMNPPFGTKKKNADRIFLQSAFQIAGSAVYSLHKSSTRPFIQKMAKQSPRVVASQVVAELRYDLPATFKFHKSCRLPRNWDAHCRL